MISYIYYPDMKDIGFYIVENKEIRDTLAKIPCSNYYVTQTRVSVENQKATFQYYEPSFSLIEDGQTRLVHISLILLRKTPKERLTSIKQAIDVIAKCQHKSLHYLMMLTILSYYRNRQTGVKLTDRFLSKSKKNITIYRDYLLSYFCPMNDIKFVTDYNSVLFKHDFSDKFINCIETDYEIIDMENDIEFISITNVSIRKERTINLLAENLDIYARDVLNSISTNTGWNFYPIYIVYEFQNYVDVLLTEEQSSKLLRYIYDRLTSLYTLSSLGNTVYVYYQNNKNSIDLENCYFGRRPIEQNEINGAIVLLLLKKLIKYNFKQDCQRILDLSYMSSSFMDILFPARFNNNYFDEEILQDVEIPYAVIEESEEESDDEDDISGNNMEMYYECETYR